MAGEGQSSFIKGLGDGLYPPLWIKSSDGEINLVAKYIILDSYSEKYAPNINFEYVFGKLNPKVTYSTTERTIDISFQLAARNVHEAKVNLDYCKLLARSVYGLYEQAKDPKTGEPEPPTLVGDRVVYKYDYEDARTYIINFGTFLRSQAVKILNFDFSMNFDAGVFDYGSTTMAARSALLGYGEGKEAIGKTQAAQWWAQGRKPGSELQEQEYVYGSESGKVLPKLVNVTLSMLALHAKPVCFGGTGRNGGVGWSLTENLDWPHGTGPIPSALYCRRDTGIVRRDPEVDTDSEPVYEEGTPQEIDNQEIDVVGTEEEKAAAEARARRIKPDQ
jgi:hypothetical protein